VKNTFSRSFHSECFGLSAASIALRQTPARGYCLETLNALIPSAVSSVFSPAQVRCRASKEGETNDVAEEGAADRGVPPVLR
jgi:hypothetical protein